MRKNKVDTAFLVILSFFVLLTITLVILIHPTEADAIGRVLSAFSTFMTALGVFLVAYRKRIQ